MRTRIEAYLAGGLSEVEGWFAPSSAEVMGELLAYQVEQGLAGGVAEIGIHHGKSFLLLANGLADGERGVALDVFDDQDRNTDRSGLGDRQRFEVNLARHAPHARVDVVASSSLDHSAAEAVAVFGRPRMFSIDGGHTAQVTEHDLRLAEACVPEHGIVVLDDLLNAHWLGVMTGLSHYLTDRSRPPRLTAFALSPNKLYLTTSTEHGARYADHLRDRLPDLLGKRDVEFFARTIDVYGQGSPSERRAEAEARRVAGVAEEATRLRSELDAAARRLRRSRRRADVARQAVQRMETSRSWRLTAPLRAVRSRRATRR